MAHTSHQLGRSDGSARPVKPIRVLLLEPSQEDAARVVEALRADGLEPLAERSVSLIAMQSLLAEAWDVLVTSDDLPDGTLEDVLTGPHNPDAIVGKGELTAEELKDLVEYLKSL